MGKSSIDRMRESRERKRALNPLTVKKTAKTALERQRERRARLRAISRNIPHLEAEVTDNAAESSAVLNVDMPSTSAAPQSNDDREVNLPYTHFNIHKSARQYFEKNFTDNAFGFACFVCDRLWFRNDLKILNPDQQQVFHDTFPEIDTNLQMVCNCCRLSLSRNTIPMLSKLNGFAYPPTPDHLPKLDLVSERLISPRIPFMQIRRLRHAHGQYGILGQIINVPVDVNTMVQQLPRNIDDDHCINVHIKRKKIHKSSYLIGLVNKRNIKAWLQYLITTPLYQMNNIKINDSFFTGNDDNAENSIPRDEVSEDIPIEESLTAQQHTLLWNDDKYLRIAPGERNVPHSLLFDEYAEELSFPTIYLGQYRTFREGLNVTPFMMATSELRRSDRRGVTPYHLLYMVMKIMRIKVRDSLSVAFKLIGQNTNITRQQIESEDYINNCIETNLAFLRSIPNSAWYWAERKRDLFAMIRQLGKPTIFLTMSANEIGWPKLLQTLHKLKHGVHISEDEAAQLSFIEKSTLINEDAVTCAVYFNKLVNTLLNILQSKKSSPFGKYRVLHYFKRIEFQHRGSPHAHILLWLEDAPQDPLGVDKYDAIALINNLISVSTIDASENIKLQKHKHTFTCYKKIVHNAPQKCRFEAPFMPIRYTTILTPMQNTEPGFTQYRQYYKNIRINLENNDYPDIDTFYRDNGITSDDYYHNILRAGINRPRVFLKREPSEKWHNPFNPFIFNILKSNMDIQFITEEYSCATYVAEYVNKTNRGISNLQRQIITVMDEHPEFNIVEITRKMSIDMLNTVEITSQEAAWYLLREPMSKTSTVVVYIPTVWPVERQRIRKTQKELNELNIGEDSTDIWKENWFDKYEKRPDNMENVTLAAFVANYYMSTAQGEYIKRKEPRVIRYRNYDMADLNEYKREMVTLHIPFRNEENDVLAELKFIETYDDNEEIILQQRKIFESNLDIRKTMDICRELCREDALNDEDEIENVASRFPEANPFQMLYNNPNSDVNSDLRMATLNKLGAIAKKRENLMQNEEFWQLMRQANNKQRALLMHVISHILSSNQSPFQIFFTGPAGCGKTFVIKLLMEIYNRFSNTDGYCNAYITCASTGKAAIAIDGTTIHTALKISLSKLLPLSIEVAQQYRTLFKYVKVIIIDEISMVGAELLAQIDQRLKQITGNFDINFGGMDIILIGDLRQLPPVRATPIYKQIKQRITGPTLWRDLKFFELDQVMRQANAVFSSLLTKIGNGAVLDEDELALIEARFFTKEEADQRCPDGIRLFLTNNSVAEYNHSILNLVEDKIMSIAKDIYIGCHNVEQENFLRQKLHKMSTIDTGGLPFEITLVLNKPYIITTNIDVSDGLANGAVGKLVYIERDDAGEVVRVWLEFPNLPKAGEKLRKKVAAHVQANSISRMAVPIARRTSSVPMNNNKTIIVKRNHFPLVSACAMTIHKSQGGTFNEIVYEYHKNHSQQLLYVALSRVTSIEGLYIVTTNDDRTFYHGRRTPRSTSDLQVEFARLACNRLSTLEEKLIEIANLKEMTLFTFNCQSLRAHAIDLNDKVVQNSKFLLLSETWIANNENIVIPNFNCIVQFKRESVRAGGVAIYQNSASVTNISTANMDIIFNQTSHLSVNASKIGDICAVECMTQNQQSILIVVVYISPNSTVKDIITFFHRVLVAYSNEVTPIFDENLREMPMIIAGDFNINFALEESRPLIEYLNNKYSLVMNNSPTEPTTRHGSTIDAVFTRYLNNVQSEIYVSYFSYHKPILTYF